MDSAHEILPPSLSSNDERRQILWPETVFGRKDRNRASPGASISAGVNVPISWGERSPASAVFRLSRDHEDDEAGGRPAVSLACFEADTQTACFPEGTGAFSGVGRTGAGAAPDIPRPGNSSMLDPIGFWSYARLDEQQSGWAT